LDDHPEIPETTPAPTPPPLKVVIAASSVRRHDSVRSPTQNSADPHLTTVPTTTEQPKTKEIYLPATQILPHSDTNLDQPAPSDRPKKRVRFLETTHFTSTEDPSTHIDIQRIQGSTQSIPTTWSSYAKYLSHAPTLAPLSRQIVELLQQFHNDLCGHHGATTTIRRLRSADHYWPTMRSDVCQFIQTCPVCQKCWAHLPKPHLAAHTLDVYEPFQCLSSDWLGPFPADQHGNEFIHVIVDAASRKLLCFPHSAQNAVNAAEDFLKVFGSYGICQYVHSDNASYYTSNLIQEFLKLLAVDHVTITPYRHESNGQVEVFNREVLRHLRAICFSREIIDKWSFQALPIVESIINNVPNSITGLSAMQYLYGPLFTAHRGLNTPFPPAKPVDKVIQELHGLQPLLIAASQRYQAQTADAKIFNSLAARTTRFPTNSYVVVTYPNRQPHKLLSRYRGPFLVKDQVKDGDKVSDTYICQDLVTGKIHQFHADRLRPYFHDADAEGLTPLQVAARDQAEYIIDRISEHTGSAKRKKDLLFKVHWLGYDDSEATWEPYKNLKDTAAFEHYCLDTPSLRSLL
jgi:hypothetical protein